MDWRSCRSEAIEIERGASVMKRGTSWRELGGVFTMVIVGNW